MGNLLIFKTDRSKNFTTISLIPILDKNLSWRAKGLHTYFMSRPPKWQIRKNDLINKSTDGETSLNSGISELEKYKYLKVDRTKREGGKFICHYIVYEKPYEPQYML